MAESAAIWKLHLIYRLSHMPERFDEAVQGKVRALEGVTSVDVAPSHDASTRLAFQPALRMPWSPPSRPNSASTMRMTNTTPRGGGGRGKCGSWTNRPTQGGVAHRGSPPGFTKDALCLYLVPIRSSVSGSNLRC